MHPSSRRHLSLFLATLSLAGVADLHAQTVLAWGSNGSGMPWGNNGTWDLSSPLWTADGGANYQAWPVAGANDTAVFGNTNDPNFYSGAQFTVTVSGALTAAGLRFTSQSYAINISGAGNSLTLATNTAFAPRIDVVDPAISGYPNAVINGALAGTSGVNFGGNGMLGLSGNNTLTGGLNINGLTVVLYANPGALASSNTLTMGGAVSDGGNNGGSGTFIYDGSSATASTSQTLSALQISSGDNTVQTNWNSSTSIALAFGSQTRAANATISYYLNGGTNGTDNKINLTSQAPGFIDTGSFFTTGGSGDYAWKDSGGFLRAIAYNTDAGTATTGTTTSIAPGVNSYFQITGNVTGQTTATLKTLRISGARTMTLTSGATLTVSGLLKAGGNSGTITGGSGIQAAAGDTLIVRADASNDVLTITTPIVANGDERLRQERSRQRGLQRREHLHRRDLHQRR